MTHSTAKYFYDFSNEKVRDGFALDSAEGVMHSVEALERLGIGMEPNMHLQMVMDAMPTNGVTTASNQVPVQFLQHWMNRFITVMTQACKADELLGRTTIGEWFQESVVLRVRELTGTVRPYGDHAQPPIAGYNWNYEDRTIVRFSQGILTGKLEEQRMAAVGQKASAYESDRAALSLAFKLNQNAVAFFGYNLGRNKTYGLLNDPNLTDYVQVPAVDLGGGETTTKWEDKDFYEIVRDLTVMVRPSRPSARATSTLARTRSSSASRWAAHSTSRRSTSTVTPCTSSSRRPGRRPPSSMCLSSTTPWLATMFSTSSFRASTPTPSSSRLSLPPSVSSARCRVRLACTSSTATRLRAALWSSRWASPASSASNPKPRGTAKGTRHESGGFSFLKWRHRYGCPSGQPANNN